MKRLALLTLALVGYACEGVAADNDWTLKETDVREVCRTIEEKTEVCFFKEEGALWISILDTSRFYFRPKLIAVQIDGVPANATLAESRTRKMMLTITPADTPDQPSHSSFRLRTDEEDFRTALIKGRTLTISAGTKPDWQMQVPLKGLAGALDRL